MFFNNSYDKIKVFVRSIPEMNNPKVEIIKTDFNNLERYKDKIKDIRLVIKESLINYSIRTFFGYFIYFNNFF